MLRAVQSGLVVLGALLAFAAPALAAKLTLTGEVTYRERIALPPGATLTVRLVDLAAPDSARVEANAALASPGQVPLTFTLNLDSAVIETGHDYALVAEIAAEGAVWFRNADPYALDPLAPATPIVIITSFTGHTTIAPEPVVVPAPPPILDLTWQAETIGGSAVVADVKTTLSIAGDMRAGGRGGCNSWFAQARIAGEALAFSAVAATRMACGADAVTQQEAGFFAALGATRFWRLRDDKLLLIDADGVELVQLGKSVF